jgi:hypothetical protein
MISCFRPVSGTTVQPTRIQDISPTHKSEIEFRLIMSETKAYCTAIGNLGIYLVLKVADAGEDHGHVAFVGRRDHFFVPHGASGLNRTGSSRLGGGYESIGKGKQSFASHH